MADALNIYFSSVFTLEDNNNHPAHEPLLADNAECLTNMLIAGYDSYQDKKAER